MKHIPFGDTPVIGILIKESALKTSQIQTEYVDQLDPLKCIGFSLEYDRKKPSAACIKSYLEQLLPVLVQQGIHYLFCCDAEYFKKLTKQTKAAPHLGYVLSCAIKGYEQLHVVYGINYEQFFYNPANRTKQGLAIQGLLAHAKDEYIPLGTGIIHSESYPESHTAISEALANLHQYDALTCDIEAYSLKHHSAGIGTIAFAWNQHEGIAFTVDYMVREPHTVEVWDNTDKKFKKRTAYGVEHRNEPIRALLKKFFEEYQGKLIYHNASYDVYVLVYQLWMEHLTDQVGLHTGLEHMMPKTECTKLLTYFATNSCAGNKLGLKEQAHEFTGAYAQEDIKDIRLIQKDELLTYNLVDCLGTWFVHDKHLPTVHADKQFDIYQLYLNFMVDIIQAQLTGMCLDMAEVKRANGKLLNIRGTAKRNLVQSPVVKAFTDRMIALEVVTRNASYKTKVITKEDAKFEFKVGSGKQLRELLYVDMGLPIIDFTKTKQAATGADTLKKLVHHTDNQQYKTVLKYITEYTQADKILSTFISKFLEATCDKDGNYFVYGSFNLGGTVSGRLSASGGINLQTIPSGSVYAKLIKQCFIAPKGMAFLGSDFNSLESVINTLLTKDPNKEKILIDGYDSHSYNTYYYWPDKFKHLPVTVEGINSIKVDFPTERSVSKPVSFALQYAGVWLTLVNNSGFSETEAKVIEANYHNLYSVSDDWVSAEIVQASKVGYAVTCFGLRVRCPVLSQVILDNSCTPREAEQEARTLGNAISGQSYGQLNSHAAMLFMRRVRASKWKYQIRVCAFIHDAIYLYTPTTFECIEWVNTNLIECMAWNELPELQHPQIKLGSELDVFYPTWNDAITLKNNSSIPKIIDICRKAARGRK